MNKFGTLNLKTKPIPRHGLGCATIKNRRSTAPAEKDFGLGVCGTWNFVPEP